MKTFNLSVSFDEARITAFAKAKGYSDTVLVDDEQVPNPESPVDFCQKYFKNFLAVEFSTIGTQQIMAQKEAEKQTAIAELQGALKEAISISVE